MSALLEVRGASKRFGGHVAVVSVDLTIDAGEAVGLIGANGAGKTTLFRMIAGELAMTRGTVRFEGRALPARPDARARRGLARTFQLVELFGGLSVLDHLLVALQAHENKQGPMRDLRLHGATSADERARCMETLELCGLAALAGAPATALSLGERRAVELARALVSKPRLLLADEPSSGLDPDEAANLTGILGRVRAETGLALLLVEHDLATVRTATERVVAMESGHVIAEGEFDEVMANPQVVSSWLGTSA